MLSMADFITVVYCLVDDWYTAFVKTRPNGQLRTRGAKPKLRDSEVITMVVVGEFLGFDTDVAIHRYFRQHWRALFPKLGHRTTLLRQATNLWAVMQHLHVALATELGAPTDPQHVIDGLPVPVCVLTRKGRCKRFRGEAATSYCAAKKTFYYGFKAQIVIALRGVITAATLTSANIDDRVAAWDVVPGLVGLLLGDKGYLGRFFQSMLAEAGLYLDTPPKAHMVDPLPEAYRRIAMACRHLIETVNSQLTERFHFNKVRARDTLHLTSRTARKILAHTVACVLTRGLGRETLDFDSLLAA